MEDLIATVFKKENQVRVISNQLFNEPMPTVYHGLDISVGNLEPDVLQELYSRNKHHEEAEYIINFLAIVHNSDEEVEHPQLDIDNALDIQNIFGTGYESYEDIMSQKTESLFDEFYYPKDIDNKISFLKHKYSLLHNPVYDGLIVDGAKSPSTKIRFLQDSKKELLVHLWDEEIIEPVLNLYNLYKARGKYQDNWFDDYKSVRKYLMFEDNNIDRVVRKANTIGMSNLMYLRDNEAPSIITKRSNPKTIFEAEYNINTLRNIPDKVINTEFGELNLKEEKAIAIYSNRTFLESETINKQQRF